MEKEDVVAPVTVVRHEMVKSSTEKTDHIELKVNGKGEVSTTVKVYGNTSEENGVDDMGYRLTCARATAVTQAVDMKRQWARRVLNNNEDAE